MTLPNRNPKAYFETFNGEGFTLVRLDNAVKVTVRPSPGGVSPGNTRGVGDFLTPDEVGSLRCSYTVRKVTPRREA